MKKGFERTKKVQMMDFDEIKRQQEAEFRAQQVEADGIYAGTSCTQMFVCLANFVKQLKRQRKSAKRQRESVKRAKGRRRGSKGNVDGKKRNEGVRN